MIAVGSPQSEQFGAMNAPARTSRHRMGLVAFWYGTTIALVFTFSVYGRQSLIDSTIDLNGFGVIARNIANGEGFSIGYGPRNRN